MKVFGRRRHLGLAVVAARDVCRGGLLQVGVSAATSAPRATSINLTEEDYFNTPGQIAALARTPRSSKLRTPVLTITREYVPFANLDTKLLTQAAGQDLPNLLAVDNPFVSTMISDRPSSALSTIKGFSTTGYFRAVINEGLSGGKYYSLPVAGFNSIALIYNIPMFKAANVPPPKTWAQLVDRTPRP